MSTQTTTTETGHGQYQEYITEFNHLIWQQVDRMLLGTPLIAMVLLQISLASEVFDQETAHGLTHLITIHGVTIGAYDIVGHMILFWMLIPTLQIFCLAMGGLYRGVRT